MDKLQNRIVPPWVGEHPDIFDDPNFSITAIDLTKSKGYDPNNESLMELSLEGMALESNKSKSMEDDIEQDEGEWRRKTTIDNVLIIITILSSNNSNYLLLTILTVFVIIIIELANKIMFSIVFIEMIPEDPLVAETYYSQVSYN